MRRIALLAVLSVVAVAGAAPAPTAAFLRTLRSLPTGDGGFRSLTVTPGRWAIPVPVVVPASVAVHVEPGAKFVGSGGATLDFAGPFEAPPVPIFEGFAVGAVTFSGGAMVRSEWWDGSPDGGYATAAATGAAGEVTLQGAISAVSTSSLTVGGGAAITKSLRSCAAWDPPELASGACTEAALYVGGGVVGADCIVGAPALPTSKGLQAACYTHLAENALIVLCNHGTAGTVDPASATWCVRLLNP